MSFSEIRDTPATSVGERANEPAKPWWRYGMLWLVIGGPLVVVVASLGTAVVAIKGADPVLTRDDASPQVNTREGVDSQTPALQARNHAATVKGN